MPPNDTSNSMLWVVGHVVWARSMALKFSWFNLDKAVAGALCTKAQTGRASGVSVAGRGGPRPERCRSLPDRSNGRSTC